MNPSGPRLVSQKRERSFVIFIITLVVLSIVVAATVGGVYGFRNSGTGIDDDSGQGVIDKTVNLRLFLQ